MKFRYKFILIDQLQLKAVNKISNARCIVWCNTKSKPSFTQYCSPVKSKFKRNQLIASE